MVGAHDREVGLRRERDLVFDGVRDGLAGNEVGVGALREASAFEETRPFAAVTSLAGQVEAVGGQLEEGLAGGGGGFAELEADARGRLAAERAHVPRHEGGIAEHDLDGFERDAQFVGDLDREAGADVLAVLHLACVTDDACRPGGR